MKNIPIAILVILAMIATVYVYLHFGFLSLRADQSPSAFEEKWASSIMDASTQRHAPDVMNPVELTDANLIEGMRLYNGECASCHGDPSDPTPAFGRSFYPPAPQFVKTPPDLPSNQSFYIIKHGIRWTGMPAWSQHFSDEQIWKLTTFLSHMDKLPSSVDQQWKKWGNS